MPEIPKANLDDTVKDEGNAADWLIQQVHSGQFLLEELVDRKAENGVYITPEMTENLEEYLEFIVGKGVIEDDCSYQGTTWQIAGRADHRWYDESADRLYISDFKYGWKIVDVKDNWTLISHAVSWMLQNRRAPSTIEFRIYQPRPYHHEGSVRSWVIDGNALIQKRNDMWAIMDNLSDQLQTSNHCYKCPSMGLCPAAQMRNMNAIDMSEQAFESEPDDDQLEFLLKETKNAMDALKQHYGAYEQMSLNRLKQGRRFKNHIITADLGREIFRDDVTPELVEMMTGVECTKKSLKTPKQCIAAGADEEFIKSLTTRPNKGVKLVRANPNEQAAKLFNK